jgi:hypothetical protein
MRMLNRLMSRLGYVKLEAYGLEVAGDGRVRTSHRTLHDDGLGGPIVGWLADDDRVANLPAWAAPPSLPAPPSPPEADDWEQAITRAHAQLAATPDFTEEAATVLDASCAPAQVRASVIAPSPPRATPPRPRIAAPTRPIPHVTRPSRPPPPPAARRIAKGTEARCHEREKRAAATD